MGEAGLGVQGGQSKVDIGAPYQFPPILQDVLNGQVLQAEKARLRGGYDVLLLFLHDITLIRLVLFASQEGPVVLVGVVCLGIFQDLAQCLCCCAAGLPVLVAKIWDDSGQQIKELLGVLLLPISKLVDSSLPNQPGAAGLKDSGK